MSFLRKQESRVSREGGNPVTFCSSLFSQGQVWIPTPRLRGDKFTPAEAGVGMTPLRLCQRIIDSGHWRPNSTPFFPSFFVKILNKMSKNGKKTRINPVK
jgi:hypothetical protein